MRKICLLSLFCLLLFSGCDWIGSYTFKVENVTQKTITLKFLNDIYYSSYSENKGEVTLLPAEEKIVRIIDGTLNTPSHDCLNVHGYMYLGEVVFETYIDGEKLDRQLWCAENWKYQKVSKWNAEYKMMITDELIEE